MENNTAENEEENLVVEKKVADLFLYFLVDWYFLSFDGGRRGKGQWHVKQHTHDVEFDNIWCGFTCVGRK